jgi:hypothetical protein
LQAQIDKSLFLLKYYRYSEKIWKNSKYRVEMEIYQVGGGSGSLSMSNNDTKTGCPAGGKCPKQLTVTMT